MPHFYERNIVEIKELYTSFLINIITPNMYQGLQHVYRSAIKKRAELKETISQMQQKEGYNPDATPPTSLRIFQIYLKDIPYWPTHMIEQETTRIRSNSKCAEWFDDLVKAVVKSYIILLTFSATKKQCDTVKQRVHEQITTEDLIHKAYIECAHQFYNFPEIFWHKYEPLELKRNQRDIMNMIQNSIKSAIGKLLPMRMVLDEFLKNDYINDRTDEDNVEHDITDSHYQNVQNMVERDLDPVEDDNFVPQKQSPIKPEDIQLHEVKDELERVEQVMSDKPKLDTGEHLRQGGSSAHIDPLKRTDTPVEVRKLTSSSHHEAHVAPETHYHDDEVAEVRVPKAEDTDVERSLFFNNYMGVA